MISHLRLVYLPPCSLVFKLYPGKLKMRIAFKIIMLFSFVSMYSLMAGEIKLKETEIVSLGENLSLEMVLIPAGKFKMGSNLLEKGRIDDETLHLVTITKPYYMGKNEVTQEQWESVMGDNPTRRGRGAKFPVTDVSWDDCQEFIKKLNLKMNGGFRLPSEAEWEYASRGGVNAAYSFGDKITPNDANYAGSKIYGPVAVGSYKPNSFGLFDMHGNVWEWCNDWYGSLLDGAVTDPKGSLSGEYRVLRGGSFLHFESNARSSFRNYNSATYRFVNVGFRLVMSK
jgi:formylglycine-generating enzyme required for sulfatase activity